LEGFGRVEGDGADLLAGFDLLSGVTGEPGGNRAQTPSAVEAAGAWDALSTPSKQDSPPPGLDWPSYLNSINLEIMRTKDYHASVIKGGAIKQMVVAGAEVFWEQLAELAKNSMGIELEQLGPASTVPDSAPLTDAVCLGTGTRW
jgi:hypothetical protein